MRVKKGDFWMVTDVIHRLFPHKSDQQLAAMQRASFGVWLLDVTLARALGRFCQTGRRDEIGFFCKIG